MIYESKCPELLSFNEEENHTSLIEQSMNKRRVPRPPERLCFSLIIKVCNTQTVFNANPMNNREFLASEHCEDNQYCAGGTRHLTALYHRRECETLLKGMSEIA